MKLLIDMNLSPDWVPVLHKAGFETTHWSDIGDPCAPDNEILKWARTKG
jgi:predicted nuclease of predicted toxin-antitoxin system